MTALKLLKYRDLARVAEMAGFYWKRSRGSHNTFQSEDGRVVVIPDHGSQVIAAGTSTAKDYSRYGLTVDEYNELTQKL